MRRFWMLAIVAVMALGCGPDETPLDPTDGGSDGGDVETCEIDPTAARVIVPVVLRTDVENNPAMEHGWGTSVAVVALIGDKQISLGAPPFRLGDESDSASPIDEPRGAIATVVLEMLGEIVTEPVSVELDRSCELVIVLREELEDDGEARRYAISYHWR